jgi:serine/threonine protein kinase
MNFKTFHIILLAIGVLAQPGTVTAAKGPAQDISRLFDENNFGIGSFEDHFTVIKKIGEGGHSSVWLIQTPTETEYVCKRTFTENIYKIMKEVKVGRLFSHQNIVKIYGVYGIEDGGYCIVTEYLDERWVDGFEFLSSREKRLPERDAKIIFRQLVDAVDYMHGKGYSHNDIKGNQILIQLTT